jgi:two-component system, chemotaxis family, protein-glutamate methylesterase/glutaminase
MSPTTARPAGEPLSQRPRVLIIDDAVVVRGLFGRWIEADGRFQMLPTCSDGQAGIAAAKRHKPDVIVLDLEMPVMDGMTALPQLLAACPDAAVMIASTLTRSNAQLSMRCLALGATEILPKPDTNRDLTLSQSFREEFIGKIAALSGARARAARPDDPASTRKPGAVARAVQDSLPKRSTRISASLASHVTQVPRYLVIGASTGGPRAVAQVLNDLKSVLPQLTTLIVQHMPPMFTSSFAEQISGQLGMPMREATDGEKPVQGGIYIAPGGRHMGLTRANGQPVLRVTDGPPVKFCRPSVDVLFHDVAAELGRSALAVILTGMGSDGADGAGSLRAAGVAVVAQDEESSVVWGMPGSVVKAGHSSLVMPLNEIGPSIRELIASANLMNVSRKAGGAA